MEPANIRFEPNPDPQVDPHNCNPSGTYSRFAWLPLVGPSAWLLWGTLAAQLRQAPFVSWDMTALAQMHGLNRGTGKNSVLRRTLTRLDKFGLFDELSPDCYLVKLTAPPIHARHLDWLPAVVTDLHHQTFGIDRVA